MTRILLSRMIVLVLFAALVVPVVSHAESVMWNFAFPFRLIDPSPSSDSCWSSMNKNSKKAYIKLHNPNVSVAYHIEAKNADTGQVISCGSTVTQGTKIMFRFIPHEYSDLYWFSLGGSFDTPYGHWIAAAGKPVADMCTYLPEQDFVNTKRTTELSDNVTGDFYVSLSIAPPAKGIAVSGALSCEGVATDPARTCTAEQVGVGTATFDWAATTGNFYGRVFIAEGGSCVPTGSCRTSNNAMQRETGDFSQVPYSMPVPAQSLSCPITVVAPSGSPPTTPSLSSGGACVVGEPHTISMTSTDPDGDDIKYGIDWNADGSIDELVPPTGFVPSGTSQQASRTYATTGEKTVRV
ncbi:MAG TPA: hypothetical protein VNM40_00940, partial [Candidatus Paceibacterota bacterium]|nr:hypothetical protein [Candidatus Paceibacterota bacterium]